jgi:hypothetical protein
MHTLDGVEERDSLFGWEVKAEALWLHPGQRHRRPCTPCPSPRTADASGSFESVLRQHNGFRAHRRPGKGTHRILCSLVHNPHSRVRVSHSDPSLDMFVLPRCAPQRRRESRQTFERENRVARGISMFRYIATVFLVFRRGCQLKDAARVGLNSRRVVGSSWPGHAMWQCRRHVDGTVRTFFSSTWGRMFTR